ncbi:hypothetical protein Sta7437_3827 [Stanieria cyanosphaera PCC 7437]|uniref:Uncharacterized protein n=1 Tax=Stanieria cyanosphaera (strain ATCC 29371 / PCC 7437) TaxID=111780 RepID=K9XZ50_STAC7|nr:hypothetical protein [Stanieria cyanosphaera]AFZ37314.1 hypothetical protein Sta7437_3827 [Stanieria cyanosphaera PCC 7437]
MGNIINAIAIIFLISSLLELNLSAKTTQAQTDTVVDHQGHEIPIDDQARYLKGLENRNSSDWNFAIGGGELTDDSYQLSLSQPNVRILEQNQPEWRNTGKDATYSILVDVYNFSEAK